MTIKATFELSEQHMKFLTERARANGAASADIVLAEAVDSLMAQDAHLADWSPEFEAEIQRRLQTPREEYLSLDELRSRVGKMVEDKTRDAT